MGRCEVIGITKKTMKMLLDTGLKGGGCRNWMHSVSYFITSFFSIEDGGQSSDLGAHVLARVVILCLFNVQGWP